MEFCCGSFLAIVAAVVIFAIIFWLRSGKKEVDISGYPPDKVVHFQFSRGVWCPSVSPFPIKLETYLRWNGIPHINDCTSRMSYKDKIPWMIYKSQVISDSQLCIDYLNKDRGLDLNAHLSAEEKAIARGFQKMAEENLYWALCAWMFQDDLRYVQAALPYQGLKLWMLGRSIRNAMQKELWHQGMGRHTLQDTINFGLSDMRALSDFLGEKRFFMGEQPSEVDCAIFGMLCMIKWMLPDSPYEAAMKEEMANLSDYCDRMKERFWPDWDEYTTKGGTQTAKI